ncbi:hypothetical protein FRC00_004026 [Tulasnella sp. 408]|nr:hypothetical protein FRC00_004026 [Tulasnella sp. 408]
MSNSLGTSALTNKEALQHHESRLDYDLYTGKATRLGLPFHWEKRADGDYLMIRQGHESLAASLMTLGRVDRGACFISPKFMPDTKFSIKNRKHSLKLVAAKEYDSLSKSFNNTWKTLQQIQFSEPEWKGAKVANLLDDTDDNPNNRSIVLKQFAYSKAVQTYPSDEGDWCLIEAWDGDANVKEKIKDYKDQGFVPRLLKVYDHTTGRRLSATEMDDMLPGALVEIVYTIRHSYIAQSKTHSFSASIQQIRIIKPLKSEPVPSIFDDHDPSTALVLSSMKHEHDHIEDDEEIEYTSDNGDIEKDDHHDTTPEAQPSNPKKLKTVAEQPKISAKAKRGATAHNSPRRPSTRAKKGKAKQSITKADNDESDGDHTDKTMESD